MFITSQAMRAVAWSALALSTAQAQYVIDNLSFGQKDGTPISPNLRAIPHFHIFGEGFTPEILSDRIFLTPPYPGSKRGALWADDPLHHKGDWTAELHFRVSGMERGSGNLQLWYTKESQNHQLPQSIYTAHKFDGMVLVIDQYDGRGGTVRGFLNDGTIDIKSHPDADTLAFGQCGYSYRNLGRLSVLKLSQSNGVLRVSVDGNGCFETDKVKLPEDYYFGISASSAENPDSFEIHKFIVSTTNSHTREDLKHDSFRQPPSQGHQQFIPTDNQGQKVPPRNKDETQQMLQDVLAGSIKSQADQFADLHNRIQIINHRVNTIYDMLERLETDSHNRHNDVMNRVAPIDDRTSAMVRNVEKVERINMDIQRDLASKDFKDMLNRVHNAIQDSHSGLSSTVPEVVNQIVAEHRHSLTSFLLIAVAVQVTVVGAYMAYKRRSKGAPKKYL